MNEVRMLSVRMLRLRYNILSYVLQICPFCSYIHVYRRRQGIGENQQWRTVSDRTFLTSGSIIGYTFLICLFLLLFQYRWKGDRLKQLYDFLCHFIKFCVIKKCYQKTHVLIRCRNCLKSKSFVPALFFFFSNEFCRYRRV